MHSNLIIKSLPYSHQITLAVFFQAAPFVETQETSGYPHFLEHMIFEGSKNFPKSEEVIKEINKLGGNFGAGTYSDFTLYEARAYYKNVNKMLEIVSDALFNPSLETSAIEKEKIKILAELKNRIDNTAWYSTSLFEQKIAKGHPLSFGVSALGTEETIKNSKREALKQYHEKYYQKSKALVVLVGNLEFLDQGLLESLFGNGEKTDRVKLQNFVPVENIGEKIKIKNTELNYLRFGFWSENMSKDNFLVKYFAGEVLNNKLEEYFRQNKGIAYSAYADFTDYVSGEYYYAEVNVEEKYIQETIEKVFDIVSKFEADEELFDVVKGRLLDIHTLEYTRDIALDIGFAKIRNRGYSGPEDALIQIEKIDIDSVNEEIQKLQKNLKSSYVVVGS